jgi:hypothetical protein
MPNTMTSLPTPEQAAWDKKNGTYTRNSYIGLGVWLALNVGSFTWVFFDKIFPYFAVAASPVGTADPARITASGNYGQGLSLLFVVVLVSAAVAVPFRRAVGNAFWFLGARPSDDYKKYVPKPIDITWEQVSDELRIARVGEWAFEVKRYSYNRLLKFRKPEYGYEVKDQSGRIDHTLVLSTDIFKGKSPAEVETKLNEWISSELERNTDYFKTPSA